MPSFCDDLSNSCLVCCGGGAMEWGDGACVCVCVCVCVWERDLERLLTLHQARGKSNQAISKAKCSAPATLAPHNYNTIWQRYWAQIPCYFCGCVYPARTWFYIKVPKMALTLSYWKERPWCPAEWANGKNMLSFQRWHWMWVKRSSPGLRWLASSWKVNLLPAQHLFKGSLVTLQRLKSVWEEKGELLWMRARWWNDTEKGLSCLCLRKKGAEKVHDDPPTS